MIKNQKILKNKAEVLFALGFGLLCSPMASHAAAVGPGGSNGGDSCENHFKMIRNDIQSWVLDGGAQVLHLPEGVSPQDYSRQILEKISLAQVSCTDQPVRVAGKEKTCRNFLGENGIPQIECNFHRYMMETSDEDQYVIAHHEYAGLAGFEKDTRDGSNFSISNQLTDYLEEKTVQHLALKRIDRVPPPVQVAGLPLAINCHDANAPAGVSQNLVLYFDLEQAKREMETARIAALEEAKKGHEPAGDIVTIDYKAVSATMMGSPVVPCSKYGNSCGLTLKIHTSLFENRPFIDASGRVLVEDGDAIGFFEDFKNKSPIYLDLNEQSGTPWKKFRQYVAFDLNILTAAKGPYDGISMACDVLNQN